MKIVFVIVAIFFVYSCEKPEGEGGYTTVSGSVLIKDYNSSFTYLLDEYVGVDEVVYIVYGDEVGYSDRTRTDYLGRFSFKYLRPGNYTVYVYSKDSTFANTSGVSAVVQKFKINKNEKSVELPEFVILN